jgi:hypothetical protein
MPEPVEITINAISMEGLGASDPRVTINISEHSPLQRQLFRNAIDNYNGSAQLSVPAPDGFPVWRVDVAFSKYDAVSGFFFQPRGNSRPIFSVQVSRLPGLWKPAFTALSSLAVERFDRFRTVVSASTNVDLKNGQPVGDLSQKYEGLADPAQIQAKMALLNLYAVLTDEQDPIERAPWFSHVKKIVRIDQERFIAEVQSTLYENVQTILNSLNTTFRGQKFFAEPHADLLLHVRNFPPIYNVRAESPMLTLKKEYEQGDMQLTMAQAAVAGKTVHLLDCDLDENRNIALHSLDLLKHIFNGGTSPVAMHEYIVEHSAQTSPDGISKINLGYQLS